MRLLEAITISAYVVFRESLRRNNRLQTFFCKCSNCLNGSKNATSTKSKICFSAMQIKSALEAAGCFRS